MGSSPTFGINQTPAKTGSHSETNPPIVICRRAAATSVVTTKLNGINYKGRASYLRRYAGEGKIECVVLAAPVVLLALGSLVGCGGGGEVGEAREDGASTAGVGPEAVSSGVALEAASGVDEAYIRESLDHLTGVSPAPLDGRETTISERGSDEGRRAAAEYMEESFEEMGIPARIIEFPVDDGTGYNVEATVEGIGGGKHLWVTAHLDSVYNAGASDDASGLVSLLSTAKALEEIGPEYTVHFVAYDLEEIGLIGSSRYVRSTVSDVRKREGEEAIIGNLHSDMIGYDEGEYDAVLGACNKAGPIDDAVRKVLKDIDSPIQLDEDCLKRSDHQNFWDTSYPAAILTDGTRYDSYPYYHRSSDTVDKLNIPYLQAMIQLIAATTALLVSPNET